MDENIPEIDIPNVYEYLLSVGRTDENYLEIAILMAKFSPIYPDDPKWQSIVLHHDNNVFDLLDDGLKVIGIVLDGKCIGYCGYRFISDPMIIIRGIEVTLPYELFMVIDDDVKIGADMIYSAQLYVAAQEHLKEVVIET